MAFVAKKGASATLVLIIFCMVVFQDISDCTRGNGYFYANAAHGHYRKARADLAVHMSTSIRKRDNSEDHEDSRTAPGGPVRPYPLDHNEGSPKKSTPCINLITVVGLCLVGVIVTS